MLPCFANMTRTPHLIPLLTWVLMSLAASSHAKPTFEAGTALLAPTWDATSLTAQPTQAGAPTPLSETSKAPVAGLVDPGAAPAPRSDRSLAALDMPEPSALMLPLLGLLMVLFVSSRMHHNRRG